MNVRHTDHEVKSLLCVLRVRPSDPSVDSEFVFESLCIQLVFQRLEKVSGAKRDDFTSGVLCNEFELTVLEGGTQLPKQHCCSLARSLSLCLTDDGKTDTRDVIKVKS